MDNDDGFFDQFRKQLPSKDTPENGGGRDSASSSYDAYSEQIHQSVVSDSAQYCEQPEPVSMEAAQSNEPATSNNGLPPESRRALVSILRQGVILAAQKSTLFELICRHQIDIRRHLSDMYLKLVLDEKSGVAFIASVNEDDVSNNQMTAANATEEEPISLITRRTLSLFDTLLLLVLRKHYQERETSGEQKVVIDIERVESNLTPFLALTNNSKSDRKKLNAALQKMVEKRILSSVRGSDDRYEITPIIRYVVNAEFLESMLVEYQRLGQEAGVEAKVDDLNDNEVQQWI